MCLAVAVLWIEFVREIRWCWEESQPLPKMPANDSIDLSTCLINQKLQMVIDFTDLQRAIFFFHIQKIDNKMKFSLKIDDFWMRRAIFFLWANISLWQCMLIHRIIWNKINFLKVWIINWVLRMLMLHKAIKHVFFFGFQMFYIFKDWSKCCPSYVKFMNFYFYMYKFVLHWIQVKFPPGSWSPSYFADSFFGTNITLEVVYRS